MNALIQGIGMILLGLGCIFLSAIIGSLVGAFVGWIVGLTPLGLWISETFLAFGITINTIQLGTTLGFIGGFFSGGVVKR
jgi:hypothetical protein